MSKYDTDTANPFLIDPEKRQVSWSAVFLGNAKLTSSHDTFDDDLLHLFANGGYFREIDLFRGG